MGPATTVREILDAREAHQNRDVCLLAYNGFVWIYNERPAWWLDSPQAKLSGKVDFRGPKEFGVPDRNETISWTPRAFLDSLEQARERADHLIANHHGQQ